jgi:hypothetical protein
MSLYALQSSYRAISTWSWHKSSVEQESVHEVSGNYLKTLNFNDFFENILGHREQSSEEPTNCSMMQG